MRDDSTRTPGSVRVEAFGFAPQRDALRLEIAAAQPRDLAVPQQAAVIDHDGARADALHVAGVVRRQQQRDAARARTPSSSSSRIIAFADTSSPIVGSSRNSMRGEWSRLATISQRIRSPSDS